MPGEGKRGDAGRWIAGDGNNDAKVRRIEDQVFEERYICIAQVGKNVFRLKTDDWRQKQGGRVLKKETLEDRDKNVGMVVTKRKVWTEEDEG